MFQQLKRNPWYGVVVLGLIVWGVTWGPGDAHQLPPDTPWPILMSAEALDSPAPVLPDTLRALDGQPILLTGYMYPMEQSRTQRRFLLAPYPAGCAFHAPMGPSSTVEVRAEDGVQFTYDAIAVQGTFTLATGTAGDLYYQLQAARQVEVPR
ncbi:MAG: DUF3299 domain-containing protein [Bacteroidota bacterium]